MVIIIVFQIGKKNKITFFVTMVPNLSSCIDWILEAALNVINISHWWLVHTFSDFSLTWRMLFPLYLFYRISNFWHSFSNKHNQSSIILRENWIRTKAVQVKVNSRFPHLKPHKLIKVVSIKESSFSRSELTSSVSWNKWWKCI